MVMTKRRMTICMCRMEDPAARHATKDLDAEGRKGPRVYHIRRRTHHQDGGGNKQQEDHATVVATMHLRIARSMKEAKEATTGGGIHGPPSVRGLGCPSKDQCEHTCAHVRVLVHRVLR